MEHFPAAMSREQSDNLATHIEAGFAIHGFGLWAVEINGGAPFVGFVGLSVPSFAAHFTPAVEIGWRLARAHWGQGYASEAARAALAAGFADFGLEQIVSFTTPNNRPSIRVMERIGMRRDVAGEFDHPKLPAGHPLQRHVLYRLDRADWSVNRTAP